MATVGRLKEGSLSISGIINERLPAVTSGLKVHYPLDGTIKGYVPGNIRYIRDWLNGSTANTGNHWVEIAAIDFEGVNVALNKTGTSIGNNWNALLVNGVTASDPYWSQNSGLAWVQVDLGRHYSLKEIQVWHYYADARTYSKTKTEVSEDGVSWFAVFDSDIEGTYKESPSGKIHDLLNLGNTVQPIINTNTTISNNGISVEEAATNLWTGAFFVYNNYGVPATLVQLDETYNGQPVYRLGMTVTDAHASRLTDFRTNLNAHGVHGGSMSWVQDTKYASSVYWRPVNKPDTIFGGTASNTAGWLTRPTEYLEDGWRKYTRYRTGAGVATRADSIHHSFCCPSLQLNETIYIDVACPQTEMNKVFTTTYTANTRGAGRIDLPFTLKPPYSINVWHKATDVLSEVISQQTSPMIFQMNGYYTNASISFWNYIKNLTVYVKGDTESGWSSTGAHYPYTASNWENVEHMYTLVMVNNTTLDIYVDGVNRGRKTSTVPVTNISYLSMGNTSQPNARYRDISMYDRALSDEEVKKLYGQSFTLTQEGHLLTKKIVETEIVSTSKTPMRAYKDKLQIPNIKEGQVL